MASVATGWRVAACVVLALFAVAAGIFASHQAIWIDETTQLFGLTLPFGQQLDWLSGAIQIASGVPPDRAAPMSYWLGGIWAGVFGLGEMQMRLFGITCLLAGAPAIWMAGLRLGRAAGALFALAAIYLAPGMIVQAGEIRSYPLFFAFSAWAVWAFVEVLCRRPVSTRHLALLALFLTLANYTHFFGLVLSGFLGGVLIAAFAIARRPVLPVLLAALAALVASAGVVPFVMGAIGVTGEAAASATPAEVLRDTARLVVRLALHGTALVWLPLAGIALLALGALALRALLAQIRAPQRIGLALLALLILALLVLPLLKLRIAGFDILAPHYNLWMVPVAMLFLAGAFRAGPGPWATVPALVLIATQLAGAALLLRHAPLYTHGPGEWLAGVIDAPDTTLVIHDGQGPWPQAYFPVQALQGGRVFQVLRVPQAPDRQITPEGLRPLPEGFDPGRFARVLMVRTRALTSRDTARLLARPDAGCGIAPMEVPAGLEQAPAADLAYCGVAAARVVDITPPPGG
ncbi:MAG: hypothetical protein VXW58_07995 [Pseudomonadota bacterium]|nr:hypothetical protein [Pseudomonadota bacterium]